jgi:hypothetical protein
MIKRSRGSNYIWASCMARRGPSQVTEGLEVRAIGKPGCRQKVALKRMFIFGLFCAAKSAPTDRCLRPLHCTAVLDRCIAPPLPGWLRPQTQTGDRGTRKRLTPQQARFSFQKKPQSVGSEAVHPWKQPPGRLEVACQHASDNLLAAFLRTLFCLHPSYFPPSPPMPNSRQRPPRQRLPLLA